VALAGSSILDSSGSASAADATAVLPALVAKSPGRWRPGSVFVMDDTTHEVVYTAPDAIEVPGLMRQLVEDLRSDDQVPPMVKAAMAHLNLAMIHPFRDGNGRGGTLPSDSGSC
jgi:hypothetical protein